ncbi:hypothetical protein GCM10011495_40240 [Hymenobacter frigidus]|uniref:Uncharacterized protein n=2 Tax=Hymenobacter frigidus TaxID=1524095 RepID=A0ABQ2AHP1_9BACT|nr:hypothetical protein GCM10011495_40240 [Hymenobacter frigidus]
MRFGSMLSAQAAAWVERLCSDRRKASARKAALWVRRLLGFGVSSMMKERYHPVLAGFTRPPQLRENRRTVPIYFEEPGGSVTMTGGTGGKESTRRMFPQVGATMSLRWCTVYIKIHVGATALRNQNRFHHACTLLLNKERAEESPGRAGYAMFEPDAADARGSP